MDAYDGTSSSRIYNFVRQLSARIIRIVERETGEDLLLLHFVGPIVIFDRF